MWLSPKYHNSLYNHCSAMVPHFMYPYIWRSFNMICPFSLFATFVHHYMYTFYTFHTLNQRSVWLSPKYQNLLCKIRQPPMPQKNTFDTLHPLPYLHFLLQHICPFHSLSKIILVALLHHFTCTILSHNFDTFELSCVGRVELSNVC